MVRQLLAVRQMASCMHSIAIHLGQFGWIQIVGNLSTCRWLAGWCSYGGTFLCYCAAKILRECSSGQPGGKVSRLWYFMWWRWSSAWAGICSSCFCYSSRIHRWQISHDSSTWIFKWRVFVRAIAEGRPENSRPPSSQQHQENTEVSSILSSYVT